MPKGGCDTVGSLSWAVRGGPHPVEGTQAGAVHGGLSPMERTHGWSSLWRMLEQGRRVRSPPPEEEGAAETTCDELTTAPVPRPPAPLGGRGENLGVKLSPGRREGWGEGV